MSYQSIQNKGVGHWLINNIIIKRNQKIRRYMIYKKFHLFSVPGRPRKYSYQFVSEKNGRSTSSPYEWVKSLGFVRNYDWKLRGAQDGDHEKYLYFITKTNRHAPCKLDCPFKLFFQLLKKLPMFLKNSWSLNAKQVYFLYGLTETLYYHVTYVMNVCFNGPLAHPATNILY